jgi:hypothetical protein
MLTDLGNSDGLARTDMPGDFMANCLNYAVRSFSKGAQKFIMLEN